MALSQIARLAGLIATSAGMIDNHLHVHNLPQPSFNVDGPVEFGLLADHPEIERARATAIEACMELSDLLQGPLALLRPTLNGTSLQAIYTYNIASKVPIHGKISFPELASQCEVYEPDLRRILRFAMVHHRVFVEPEKGFVAHTAASRMLVEHVGVYDGLGLMFDETWQSMAQKTVNAMQRFKSQEPTETGFSLAHGTNDTVFGYLDKHPDKAKRFASAMRSFTVSLGHQPFAVIKAYSWESLGQGLVVDIGGSQGHVSIALAQSYPSLSFIVQDRPEVIKGAAVALPDDLCHRITFMAHDFFADQPVKADVYLFRYVLHDWSDSYCVKILRGLVPSLREGARVIVNDGIMPEPGTLSYLAEKQARAMDLTMLSLFNARERDVDAWESLFRQADDRFIIVGVQIPKGSGSGIIEAKWLG